MGECVGLSRLKLIIVVLDVDAAPFLKVFPDDVPEVV